jgi:hypothetical protein
MISCSLSCDPGTIPSPDPDPVEDCLTMHDEDNDDKSGCRDEDCLSEPTCQLAYDLHQAAVIEWFRYPMDLAEYDDYMVAGRYDTIGEQDHRLVAVTCAPGYADPGIGLCDHHDNTGSYTQAWLLDAATSDQSDGFPSPVDLPQEDAFFTISGSWGQTYLGSGVERTQKQAHASTLLGDLDGDGFNDVLLSQPVAAIGDVLYAWYGGEDKELSDTFPDFSLPGRDFTRVRHAGDLTGDGYPDVVVTEGPVEDGYAAVVPGGVRYTAQTLQDVLEAGAISMKHPPEDIYAWAFPGKPADLVSDSRDDLAVVTLCMSHDEDVVSDNLCSVAGGGISVPVLAAGEESWEEIDDLTARQAWTYHGGAHDVGGGGLPVRTAVDVADLDGDGRDDLLVGMPVASLTENDETVAYGTQKGGVLVYGGKEGGWQGQQYLDSGDDRVVVLKQSSGGGGSYYFGLILVAHDFDGDGFDDVLVWNGESARPAIAAEWGEDADVFVDIYAGSADFFDRGVVVRPVAVLLRVGHDQEDFPEDYADVPPIFSSTVPIMPEMIGDVDGGGVADIYLAGIGGGSYINLIQENVHYDIYRAPFAITWSGERIRDLIVEGKALQEAAR